MRAARLSQYLPIVGGAPRPRAAAACGRHNRKPDSAKNTATARSNRPQTRPITGSPVAPVWNATCVTSTPNAANPRIPSSAGTNARGLPTGAAVARCELFIAVKCARVVVEPKERRERSLTHVLPQMGQHDC
ncbi:hypothetical protein GCM10027068_14490 [Prescottella soli]